MMVVFIASSKLTVPVISTLFVMKVLYFTGWFDIHCNSCVFLPRDEEASRNDTWGKSTNWWSSNSDSECCCHCWDREISSKTYSNLCNKAAGSWSDRKTSCLHHRQSPTLQNFIYWRGRTLSSTLSSLTHSRNRRKRELRKHGLRKQCLQDRRSMRVQAKVILTLKKGGSSQFLSFSSS